METQAGVLVDMWGALVDDNNALWTFHILVLAAVFAFAFSSSSKMESKPIRIALTFAFLIFVISNIVSHMGHIHLVNKTLAVIENNDLLNKIFTDFTILGLGPFKFRVSPLLVGFIHLTFDTAAIIALAT